MKCTHCGHTHEDENGEFDGEHCPQCEQRVRDEPGNPDVWVCTDFDF